MTYTGKALVLYGVELTVVIAVVLNTLQYSTAVRHASVQRRYSSMQSCVPVCVIREFLCFGSGDLACLIRKIR